MAIDDTASLTPLEDLLNGFFAELNARVQAGTDLVVINTASVVETVTVPFPVAFPSVPSVTVTYRGGTGTGDTRTLWVTTRTATEFTVAGLNTASTADMSFDWIAVLP